MASLNSSINMMCNFVSGKLCTKDIIVCCRPFWDNLFSGSLEGGKCFWLVVGHIDWMNSAEKKKMKWDYQAASYCHFYPKTHLAAQLGNIMHVKSTNNITLQLSAWWKGRYPRSEWRLLFSMWTDDIQGVAVRPRERKRQREWGRGTINGKRDALLSRMFDKFVDRNLNVILSTSRQPVAHKGNRKDLGQERGDNGKQRERERQIHYLDEDYAHRIHFWHEIA